MVIRRNILLLPQMGQERGPLKIIVFFKAKMQNNLLLECCYIIANIA